jgi:undecaprenyl pyrophosphate synthase
MIRWSIIDNRISHLVVYLLSYDNYRKRSKEEQSSIISLLQSWVSEFEMLNRSNQADIAILGEPDDIFREALGGLPINPEKRDMTKTRVSLLLCYDGRREIHQSGGDPSKMWLQEDIDVVIRTGFTQRASGFCTYQTGYSEWFYPGVYWPEFNVQTFKNLLDESYKVQRNFGV